MIDQAAQALERCCNLYQRHTDCRDPDLYHLYREGAKQFEILNTLQRLDLFLVPDNMLAMEVSPGVMARGLTAEKAHRELQEYCRDVDNHVLTEIAWPSLAAFLGGWLKLSIKTAGTTDELFYLMYAERLIDANDMDDAWFERSFKDVEVAKAGRKLLAGREARIAQDKWD